MQPELELYKEYNKQDDICERRIRGCSNYTGMLLCSASHEPVTKSLTLENENECRTVVSDTHNTKYNVETYNQLF